jgi:CHASE3 domain sensor protein
MFSWIALEEMLDSYVAENKLSAPAGLRDRLAAALKHISSVDPASDSFQEARKIRNLLTHGTDDRTEAAILTANSASKVFNYCASMIAQLGGHRKLCLSLDDGTWRPWGEKRPRRRLP